MKFVQIGITFILGVLLTMAMLFYELPFWLIFISVMIFYFILQLAPQLYVVYGSNNLQKIEKHLIRNKKNPVFALPLALKNGDKEEIRKAIETILARYRSPYMQQVYKTMLAIFERNVAGAEAHAKLIQKEPLRSYYIAYVEVLKGNYEEARAIKDSSLKSAWMQHAIEALIAKEQGNLPLYEEEAKACVFHARGVQKYNLYYSFRTLAAI